MEGIAELVEDTMPLSAYLSIFFFFPACCAARRRLKSADALIGTDKGLSEGSRSAYRTPAAW